MKKVGWPPLYSGSPPEATKIAQPATTAATATTHATPIARKRGFIAHRRWCAAAVIVTVVPVADEPVDFARCPGQVVDPAGQAARYLPETADAVVLQYHSHSVCVDGKERW